LVLIVAYMKCSCLSVLTLSMQLTHRKLRCVGKRANWLMIYVPAEVISASVFAALHSRAPGQSSTSGTECHTVLVRSRVQLQETVSAGTGSRGVSCLSSLFWTIILAVWWSDSKKTEQYWVSLCRRVFLKLNRHMLHWTQCTVNSSVTCFLVLKISRR